MAEFRIKKDQTGEWRWKFKADNGKIIADSSEAYKNEEDCRDGIELVKAQAQTASSTGPVSHLLLALLAKVPDSAERGFIEEAITCIRAGAPRAAIVLGWCAVIDRMRRKVQIIGFDKFNAASITMKNNSTGKFKRWNKGVQANSANELLAIFDNDLIIVLVGMGLLDENEARRLNTMFDWRCDCAHPSAAPIGPSHVVTFFTDAVDLVLADKKFEIP